MELDAALDRVATLTADGSLPEDVRAIGALIDALALLCFTLCPAMPGDEPHLATCRRARAALALLPGGAATRLLDMSFDTCFEEAKLRHGSLLGRGGH